MKLALAGTQFHANFPTAVSLHLVSRRCRAKMNVPTNIFAFAKSRSFKENLIPHRGLHRSTRARNIVGILNVYLPLYFFSKFIFIGGEKSREQNRTDWAERGDAFPFLILARSFVDITGVFYK